MEGLDAAEYKCMCEGACLERLFINQSTFAASQKPSVFLVLYAESHHRST